MQNSESKILEDRNIKPTSGRILILKSIRGFDRAFSMTDLEMDLDTVDKSTISRTLRLFHNNSLIHSFDDGSGSTKYSLCQSDCTCTLDELHAHFHCNYCQKSFCLENIPIPKLSLPENLIPERINFVIKGFCKQCKKFAP